MKLKDIFKPVSKQDSDSGSDSGSDKEDKTKSKSKSNKSDEKIFHIDDLDPIGLDIVKKNKIKNFSMIVAAKRRSGKTVLVQDLMYRIKDWYDDIFLFYGSKDVDADNYKFVPEENKYIPNPKALEKIVNDRFQYVKNAIAMGMKKDDINPIIIIVDDFLDYDDFRKSKILKNLFMRGRHGQIALIIILQEFGGLDGVSKSARANTDYFVSFLPRDDYDRELVIRQFLSVRDKKQGNQLLLEVLADDNIAFRHIIIDNTQSTRDYSKFVTFGVANPKLPKFMIGGDKYATGKPETIRVGKIKSFKRDGFKS